MPIIPPAPLVPFSTPLPPPIAIKLAPADSINVIHVGSTTEPMEVSSSPNLSVPAWGYGIEIEGKADITWPGPLLETTANVPVIVMWKNDLPKSYMPDEARPADALPFATWFVDPGEDTSDSPTVPYTTQNLLGTPPDYATTSARVQSLADSPIGWTSVHLHGGHTHPDSDGWPDNMAPIHGTQLALYDNSYDNTDIVDKNGNRVDLGKIGAFLWYHDHAMNGTRYHVYSGQAGGWLLRDPREATLGLPVSSGEGEIVLILQDRNLVFADDGSARLMHKVTANTGEFFGPVTMVNGKIWPTIRLQPNVYRLRFLNGSNARAYRLHLVTASENNGQPDHVRVEHKRVLVIGTDGGLMWKARQLNDKDALTMAPAERFDTLLDLTNLGDIKYLYLINSAEAPFDGTSPPGRDMLETLWNDGVPQNRNPFPWVMRIEIDPYAPTSGKPGALFTGIKRSILNPNFKRLVHPPAKPCLDQGKIEAKPSITIDDGPATFELTNHEHKLILLGEGPAGHLFLHEAVEDPMGCIQLQFPAEKQPCPPASGKLVDVATDSDVPALDPIKSYRVEAWDACGCIEPQMRPSFYDRIVVMPMLGQWQVWKFLNLTADAHPIHIHQSTFQPLGESATKFVQFLTDKAGNPITNLYDPERRLTFQPIIPLQDSAGKLVAGRTYESHEITGWKDVIRVYPGEMVEVAIRFDRPGRYVYHCHILEHEDTEMMRPFVVTATDMSKPMDMGNM